MFSNLQWLLIYLRIKAKALCDLTYKVSVMQLVTSLTSFPTVPPPPPLYHTSPLGVPFVCHAHFYLVPLSSFFYLCGMLFLISCMDRLLILSSNVILSLRSAVVILFKLYSVFCQFLPCVLSLSPLPPHYYLLTYLTSL